MKLNTPAFSDGKIKVQNEEGLWGFLNLTGKFVGEVKWSQIGNFGQGLAAVCENKKYGYIDAEANVVIAPQYDDARVFSEGQAWVKKGEKWQCIDKDNNVIIPALYSEVTDFQNGRAEVNLPGTGWQIIDAYGNLLYFKQDLSSH
ncbi:MAG: WG repeat-containing protein [Clostridia bacterium]|nr:WG repeat-containing protein [Clostridia bacterium]